MTRDWGGLRSVLDEAKAVASEDAARPLVDCPRCGTLLVVNSAAVRNCPMGHFRTTAQTWGDYARQGWA